MLKITVSNADGEVYDVFTLDNADDIAEFGNQARVTDSTGETDRLSEMIRQAVAWDRANS